VERPPGAPRRAAGPGRGVRAGPAASVPRTRFPRPPRAQPCGPRMLAPPLRPAGGGRGCEPRRVQEPGAGLAHVLGPAGRRARERWLLERRSNGNLDPLQFSYVLLCLDGSGILGGDDNCVDCSASSHAGLGALVAFPASKPAAVAAIPNSIRTIPGTLSSSNLVLPSQLLRWLNRRHRREPINRTAQALTPSVLVLPVRAHHHSPSDDVVVGINYYAPHVSGLSITAQQVAESLVAAGYRVGWCASASNT
jgi:hypothetical protein